MEGCPDCAGLEALFDAFNEGQEASIEKRPRSENPYPPGDSWGVGPLWLQWDDGYDCNINRMLKAELAAADAQYQTFLAQLRELSERYRARGQRLSRPDCDAEDLTRGNELDDIADELLALIALQTKEA